MKPLFLLFFYFLTASVGFAANTAVQLDVPAAAKAQYEAAEILRGKGQFTLTYPIYAELLKQYPNSFSVHYGYGLLLAQMKRFPDAAEALRTALNLGKTKEQMPDPSIWNSIGWVSIMNNNLDQALEYFSTAKDDLKLYASLNDETKMKLHNNAGYALMLMDRYDEAKKEFQQAEQLGSKKARSNIEKVDSLIETQQKQDPDIPGVFAIVVFSIKNKDGIDKAVQSLSDRMHSSSLTEEIKKAANAINIYLAQNGMYLFALGGNYSYAKAQGMLSKVQEAMPDAFVSSTTNWEPVRIGGMQVPPSSPEQQH